MNPVGWEFEFSNVSDIEYMIDILSQDGFNDFFFYETKPNRKLRMITYSFVYDMVQRCQYILWLVKHTPRSVRLLLPGTERNDNEIYTYIPEPVLNTRNEWNNRICELCALTDLDFRTRIHTFQAYVKTTLLSRGPLYDVLIDLLLQYIPLYSIYDLVRRNAI